VRYSRHNLSKGHRPHGIFCLFEAWRKHDVDRRIFRRSLVLCNRNLRDFPVSEQRHRRSASKNLRNAGNSKCGWIHNGSSHYNARSCHWWESEPCTRNFNRNENYDFTYQKCSLLRSFLAPAAPEIFIAGDTFP